MFIGLNRKNSFWGLKIGRGNPRETEESEKRVTLLNLVLDLSKERTLWRCCMTGIGYPKSKEGESTSYTQQVLQMCSRTHWKKSTLGRRCEYRTHRKHYTNSHRSCWRKMPLGEGDLESSTWQTMTKCSPHPLKEEVFGEDGVGEAMEEHIITGSIGGKVFGGREMGIQ